MVRFLADASLHLTRPNWKESMTPLFLALASREDRIVVTSDLKTMPRHFAGFLQAHGHCPGIFLMRQSTPLADVIEDLVMVWAASDAGEWRNRIIEIPSS